MGKNPIEKPIFVTFVIGETEYKPIKLPDMGVNHADACSIKSFKSVHLITIDDKKTPYSVSVYISRKMTSKEISINPESNKEE
jgi:hypothetical protein